MARKTNKPAATGQPRSGARTRVVTERHGRVWFGDIPAGELEERPDGVVVFRYLPEYLARPDSAVLRSASRPSAGNGHAHFGNPEAREAPSPP